MILQNYQDGVNCTWDQDFARNALVWERRLEFAMEDTRFFDLVRWGIAAETLNGYLTVRKPNVHIWQQLVQKKSGMNIFPFRTPKLLYLRNFTFRIQEPGRLI